MYMCVCLLLVIKDIKGIPRAEGNITRRYTDKVIDSLIKEDDTGI